MILESGSDYDKKIFVDLESYLLLFTLPREGIPKLYIGGLKTKLNSIQCKLSTRVVRMYASTLRGRPIYMNTEYKRAICYVNKRLLDI